jgi:hypothetical protein
LLITQRTDCSRGKRERDVILAFFSSFLWSLEVLVFCFNAASVLSDAFKLRDFRGVRIRYACFTDYHQGKRKLWRRLREEI